ncbi:putative MxaS protein involved in methanol oxidation [Methyloglobulus morosus KoM1]|uniref:Putative MxaS protein involved in methanol oxidation n=1 Tax=Methyloglobulus morosus KoM1 TaxID=1116472 RepID=V5C0K2_9GAMM|nr:MxaS protein involved in methanol oxidation [Methyloglobulus morosus]ESS73604.1 putative MxaS protein involved in methanol oxidation [Methyloglobulus morosus KoM1]
MTARVEPFIYKIPPLGHRPSLGAHRGQMAGSGQLFTRHDSLLARPDPRRLDLRASALDPFGNYRVKVFQQHTQLPVVLIADLSASMRYQGKHSRQQALADFVLSAALSATQTGDSFTFIGCGKKLERQWLLAANRSVGSATELAQRLAKATFTSQAESLWQLSPVLPSKRSLLFLASDFYMPLGKISALMAQLTQHIVVPVVFWDESEYQALPDWGIVKLKDLESGKTKTLLLRPNYKCRIIEAYTQRKLELQKAFRSFGVEPLFIIDNFQAQRLTAYFHKLAG